MFLIAKALKPCFLNGVSTYLNDNSANKTVSFSFTIAC